MQRKLKKKPVTLIIRKKKTNLDKTIIMERTGERRGWIKDGISQRLQEP